MEGGGRARRRHSAEFKRQVLAECARPGASVAGVALAHRINANLVQKWRRQARGGGVGGALRADATFVPVAVAAAEPAEGMPPAAVHVEVHRGAVCARIRWPVVAAADCAGWLPADNNWIENRNPPDCPRQSQLALCRQPARRSARRGDHEPDRLGKDEQRRSVRLPARRTRAAADAPGQLHRRFAAASLAAALTADQPAVNHGRGWPYAYFAAAGGGSALASPSASSRSTLRSACISCSACCIWAMNSGS